MRNLKIQKEYSEAVNMKTDHCSVIFRFWQSKKNHAQTTERRPTYTATILTCLLYVDVSSCENKKFEDTKGTPRSRKSKKDRQHNCQKKIREVTTMIYKD